MPELPARVDGMHIIEHGQEVELSVKTERIHFFTVDDGQLVQKLLIIRLAQTQHDDLFCPTEVIDLDVVCQE